MHADVLAGDGVCSCKSAKLVSTCCMRWNIYNALSDLATSLCLCLACLLPLMFLLSCMCWHNTCTKLPLLPQVCWHVSNTMHLVLAVAQSRLAMCSLSFCTVIMLSTCFGPDCLRAVLQCNLQLHASHLHDLPLAACFAALCLCSSCL